MNSFQLFNICKIVLFFDTALHSNSNSIFQGPRFLGPILTWLKELLNIGFTQRHTRREPGPVQNLPSLRQRVMEVKLLTSSYCFYYKSYRQEEAVLYMSSSEVYVAKSCLCENSVVER